MTLLGRSRTLVDGVRKTENRFTGEAKPNALGLKLGEAEPFS